MAQSANSLFKFLSQLNGTWRSGPLEAAKATAALENIRPINQSREGDVRSLQYRWKAQDQLSQAQTKIPKRNRGRKIKTGRHQKVPAKDRNRIPWAVQARAAGAAARGPHPQTKKRVSHPQRNRVVLLKTREGHPGEQRSRQSQLSAKTAGKVQDAARHPPQRSRTARSRPLDEIRRAADKVKREGEGRQERTELLAASGFLFDM